jgi:hypothetical protein
VMKIGSRESPGSVFMFEDKPSGNWNELMLKRGTIRVRVREW